MKKNIKHYESSLLVVVRAILVVGDKASAVRVGGVGGAYDAVVVQASVYWLHILFTFFEISAWLSYIFHSHVLVNLGRPGFRLHHIYIIYRRHQNPPRGRLVFYFLLEVDHPHFLVAYLVSYFGCGTTGVPGYFMTLKYHFFLPVIIPKIPTSRLENTLVESLASRVRRTFITF